MLGLKTYTAALYRLNTVLKRIIIGYNTVSCIDLYAGLICIRLHYSARFRILKSCKMLN